MNVYFYLLLAPVIGGVIVLMILRWVTHQTKAMSGLPVETIHAMGGFFSKVLPRIPISKILRFFGKRKPPGE